MIDFIPDFPISELSPADYNPRRIDEESFQMLRESLARFGVIKPVLLNGNGILMAGHQRIKALIANGETRVPALKTKQVALKDEARLNLYHNSVETGRSQVRLKEPLAMPGYHLIQPSHLQIIEPSNPAIVAEICRLILKCGEWGSLILSSKGEVLYNSDYAVATARVRKPVWAYVLPPEHDAEIEAYFARDYGQYNYDTLPVHNMSQTKCQMHRLRTGPTGKANASTCYEMRVIPTVTREQRGIDFGEGYGDYRRMLQADGYRIIGYEPFQTPVGSAKIDLPSIRAAIKRIEESVKRHGLFDYVVLDSVINSVTSLDFEHYVLQTCASLLRNDGVFFTGTRSFEFAHTRAVKKCTRKQRNIEFLDKDGFSTIFRDGVWTKQRFHTKETLEATLLRYFEEVEIQPWSERAKLQIHAVCRRPRPASGEVIRKAVETEFNLDYNGRKLNCSSGLVEAIMLELESNGRISDTGSA